MLAMSVNKSHKEIVLAGLVVATVSVMNTCRFNTRLIEDYNVVRLDRQIFVIHATGKHSYHDCKEEIFHILLFAS